MDYKTVIKSMSGYLLLAIAVIGIGACAPEPLLPYSSESTPLVLVPVSRAGVEDERGRFREIFCAVLEERSETIPDYQPCEEVLTKVGVEPEGTGADVDLGGSGLKLTVLVVPGVGWNCFSDWLDLNDSIAEHVRQFGYDLNFLEVDGLSSSTNNARQIRDAVMAIPKKGQERDLVLIGHSKGANDVLETVVNHPETHSRIAAVVSLAGAIGGSPLANDTTQSQLALMQHWPGARCKDGDSGALESLRPSVRKAWLSDNPLPQNMLFFSLVAFPGAERVSSILRDSYKKLSQVDSRNDSQLLFYDQIIPGGTLYGVRQR